MKVIAILLVALISVAFAAPRDDDCMICTEKVDILWNLINGEGEGYVEHMIIKQVCSKETNPSECTMLVKQYWGKVSMALFTHATAKDTCVGMEFCSSNKRSGDDWNCDTCKSGAMELGGFLTSDKASDASVTFLQGKAFCQDPGLGLSGDDIKTCQDYIANYIPKIMKHVFNGLKDREAAEMICERLYQIC